MATAARAPAVSTGIPIRFVPSSTIIDPHGEIERRAYELYQARSSEEGSALGDWLRAESEILRPMPVEVIEDDDVVMIKANVLGFWSDELRVAIEQNVITIVGKKVVEPQPGDKPTYMELEPDAIFRRIHLPMAVIPESAGATLNGGWLDITIQRATASWAESTYTC